MERAASLTYRGTPPMLSAEPAPFRRVLDIEHVLQWAFRDELPKRRDDHDDHGGSYVSPMFRMCALGGRVDNWNREPGYPAAMGAVHPDALIVEEEVQRLKATDVDIAGFARSFGGDPDGINVEVIADAVTGQVATLIALRARLGARPEHGDIPDIEPVRGPNGQITVFAEQDGHITLQDGSIHKVRRAAPVTSSQRRGGHYPVGSFSKIRFAPGRVAIYTERAEYAAWRAGLVVLAARLDGMLSSIRPTGPAAARRPWEGERDLGTTGRTLQGPGVAVAGKAKVYPTGGPLRSSHGPVRHIPVTAA